MGRVTTIGFLHTADVHVPAFRALLRELAPGIADRHVVDPGLLADARAGRPYQDGLRARLGELGAAGAEVVVCTCSTIAGAAEQAAPNVVRIDRPMAEAAARYPRIGVGYAVESTLAPTRALLAEVGAGDRVVEIACPAAWPLFEAGDLPGYHAAVADRVRAAAGAVDVVLLAQASMAPAAALLADLPVPVLTSPALAVREAVSRARHPLTDRSA